MNSMRPVRPSLDRSGTAAVEFAVMLPLLLLVIVGSVEIGRAINVQHKLEEASRAGCRIYITGDATPTDAEEMVDVVLANSGITNYTVTLDPASTAEKDAPMEPVTVSVSVSYDDVTWIASPWFMEGATLQASCVMPVDLNSSIEGEEEAGGGGLLLGGSGGSKTTPLPTPPKK